ncbi:leucine-rich repeat-containing protein 15 [Drosophila sulfurigaster albostrigata]|uniref:leucine-rich repeat-containing protein 15 n=1 Tax=Drosophila sulfurigaster albostrigata TaxID=89887 RepID=UPI002D21C977|nr:leucine-rich repeat-containing protein 15 [Drosophila sulfurigaster albostrigata]XP_062120785.1 leucine-rich repeat-containing protein 15 [Drosophila sulfurigaster albostrigata]XP_062120787.1 leucine-rich repeat-containing protein 15 [Drosophila sulfurigaster albostrigata]
MLLKWLLFSLCIMPALFSNTRRKCPVECSCSLDDLDRFQAICTKGGLSSLSANQLDVDVKVIIVRGPRNSITIGPAMRQFTQLQVLRITDSNLPAIGAESLWGLKHLCILDLSKNNITNITENNFRGQDNLLELDLSKNKILRMASSTFRHLTDLRRLNLADNSIVELVQRNFFMLSKLKYLDLSGNPLQDLQPDVFRDVTELKVLKCRNCQLKKINPQLYNLLPHLSELDLGRNEFKFLDKDEFHDVKHLTKVLLDGNQLSVVVDQLFRMQKSLNHLDLSYNRLAKVPNDSFLQLTNLTFLDLSYNKLVRLEPQSVRSLSNLRVLNISGNVLMDLREMHETFELIPDLTHLAVADMGQLPVGLLTPFRQLRYLNISGNSLDNMALQVIDPCRELEYLDLSRNQLYGINADTAMRIQGIRNVRLDNNPLICDECHMGKLINVVRQLQWKWDTYPICFLPKSLRGAEIINLDIGGLHTCLDYISDEEQNAASTSYNFLEHGGLNTLAILGGIIFVLIAVIILSLVACFSKNRARYYTREDHLTGSDSKCLEKNLEATTITTLGNGSSPTTTTTLTLATSPAAAAGTATSTNGHVQSPANGNTPAHKTHDGGKEINFTFPIDDRVCTIDELVLPASASASASPTIAQVHATTHPSMGSLLYSVAQPNVVGGSMGGTATVLAAASAAATVIPPGAPSPMPAPAPADAVVVVLPPPPPPQLPHQQHQHHHHQHHPQLAQLPQHPPQHQQMGSLASLREVQQQLVHLSSTLEPLVSVN